MKTRMGSLFPKNWDQANSTIYPTHLLSAARDVTVTQTDPILNHTEVKIEKATENRKRVNSGAQTTSKDGKGAESICQVSACRVATLYHWLTHTASARTTSLNSTRSGYRSCHLVRKLTDLPPDHQV